MISLSFVSADQLTSDHKRRMKELQTECFSAVTREEAERVFFAQPFGAVFASDDEVIIGQSELFRRLVSLEGTEIVLGGIGGVCVTSSRRRGGIGTKLVSACVDILRERGCDVACLAAHPKNNLLYQRLGFRRLERRISFEDAGGMTRYDDSEMFRPLTSLQAFELIMKSDQVLHMGRGLW